MNRLEPRDFAGMVCDSRFAEFEPTQWPLRSLPLATRAPGMRDLGPAILAFLIRSGYSVDCPVGDGCELDAEGALGNLALGDIRGRRGEIGRGGNRNGLDRRRKPAHAARPLL